MNLKLRPLVCLLFIAIVMQDILAIKDARYISNTVSSGIVLKCDKKLSCFKQVSVCMMTTRSRIVVLACVAE